MQTMRRSMSVEGYDAFVKSTSLRVGVPPKVPITNYLDAQYAICIGPSSP